MVAPKDIKQVSCATSTEHGTLVTMVAAISVNWNFVPLMFLFPRLNFKDRMLYSLSPGLIGTASPLPSEWSNEETLMKYLQHFIKHLQRCREHHVLLIIDNHEMHLSIEALDIVSNPVIVIVTFPPHILHKLQPLDLYVYGPLKNCYHQLVRAWLLNHPGQTYHIYAGAEIMEKEIWIYQGLLQNFYICQELRTYNRDEPKHTQWYRYKHKSLFGLCFTN